MLYALVPPLLLLLVRPCRWVVLVRARLHVLLLWLLLRLLMRLLREVLALHILCRCLHPTARYLHLWCHRLLGEITLLRVHLGLARRGESHAGHTGRCAEALRRAHHAWCVVALRIHALSHGHLLAHVLHLQHLTLARFHLSLLFLHLALILQHHSLVNFSLHGSRMAILLLCCCLFLFTEVDITGQTLRRLLLVVFVGAGRHIKQRCSRHTSDLLLFSSR